MTTIFIRSPLQPLPMNRTSANTNNRRRTTRHVFEDDDEPPAKKVKMDATTKGASQNAGPTAKPTINGKANGTVSRSTRQKKSYEEEDEGFAFSRTRSTRSKAKVPQQPPPEPATARPIQSEHPAPVEEAPAKQPPKKKSRKTLPVTPEKDDAGTTDRPRRSKRLSGETRDDQEAEKAPSTTVEDVFTENAKTVDPPTAAHTIQAPQSEQTAQPAPAIQAEDTTIPVQPRTDKKRRMTKIDLVFAETPVIRRNKEMRKTSGDGHRRSSSGIRGKRASSLIDAGTSNAVPHSEVNTMEFYKHISQDLTEPRRMRQLLVWCGNRALPPKPSGGLAPDESQARHAARVIVDELLADFGNRNDLSNWFDREDTATTALVKKPNPRNIQNAAKLQELEVEIARLQAEKRSWDELLSTSKAQANSVPETEPMDLDPAKIDASLLDPSQVEILHTLMGTSSSTEEASTTNHTLAHIQSRINDITKPLEGKIDLFVDSMHRLEQYRQGAERVADRILASGADRLEERDQERKEKTGGQVDSMDVLRALSRAANKAGKEGSR
ncbi:hypothetical protein MBLNU457_6819t1 [Dothideomycetes sp. NU457]